MLGRRSITTKIHLTSQGTVWSARMAAKAVRVAWTSRTSRSWSLIRGWTRAPSPELPLGKHLSESMPINQVQNLKFHERSRLLIFLDFKMDYKEGWMSYWTSSSKPFGRIWEVVLDAKKLTSPKNDPNGASTAVKLPHATIVPSAKMAPLFSNNPAEKTSDPICFSKNIYPPYIPQNAYCITPNATVHCSRILRWILGVLILSDADAPRLWESSNLKLKSPKETYSYGPSMWKS